MSKAKNLLEKLRPDRTDKKQVKTVERIAAIGHTTDAVGWRPVSYTIPDRFRQFLDNLDADIDHFIAHAHPDQYNPRFYEKTVDEEVALALQELEMQREEHIRSIHNIRTYQHASLKDMESHLQRMKETLDNIKEVQ